MDKDLTLIKFMLMPFGIGNDFNPITSSSENYKRWVTNFGPNTCKSCARLNGTVYEKGNLPQTSPPLHPNCNCAIIKMTAIKAGTASADGLSGADLSLQNGWGLPEKYITKSEAENYGYKKWEGNLADVLPGLFIGGAVFENKKNKLPSNEGRVWYEADINYTRGYRNGHRIIYSNDGLIFVTYDHYETFYEIN